MRKHDTISSMQSKDKRGRQGEATQEQVWEITRWGEGLTHTAWPTSRVCKLIVVADVQRGDQFAKGALLHRAVDAESTTFWASQGHNEQNRCWKSCIVACAERRGARALEKQKGRTRPGHAKAAASQDASLNRRDIFFNRQRMAHTSILPHSRV
eukprot:6174223-Pleurochrysis_carterae.AAC.1